MNRGILTGLPPRLAVPLLFLLVTVIAASCRDMSASDDIARVGFIAEGEVGARALRGARLGAEEAEHAARMLGGSFALLTGNAATSGEAAQAAGRLIEQGATVIIGGFDDESCEALSRLANARGIIFLNVGCTANRHRTDDSRNTFHVAASQAMHDRAISMTGRGGVLWHGDLERFGAAQLNERFVREFEEPMDAAAWAGWMAVKLAWEAASRSGRWDPDGVRTFLTAPGVGFDGHKGQALTFDPRTRQLLQPLFPLQPSGSGAASATALPDAYHALPDPSHLDLLNRPFLFVSNEGSQDVTVVDLDEGVAVARIALGNRPRGIHLSSDGSRLYVALSDDAPLMATNGDAIAVLDLAAGAAIVARFPAGSDPEQFALTPDGRRLYASNEDAGTATAIDLLTGDPLATMVVGIEPEGVAASPDGRWIYVTAETSNTVSVIDTRTNEVVAGFLVDQRPRAAAFAPVGARAYVTNEISGTLFIVDTNRHRVIGTVDLGADAKPVGVVVSPDGRWVYVATGHGNGVAVVEAESGRLVRTIPVGQRPWGIAISADGTRLYTANGLSNDVSEIDLAAGVVTRTFEVGERPWGIGLGSGGVTGRPR